MQFFVMLHRITLEHITLHHTSFIVHCAILYCICKIYKSFLRVYKMYYTV